MGFLRIVKQQQLTLRQIPVARRADTSVYYRVDIDLAVPVDTGLVRHLVRTDPEHHTGSLLVGPDREHLRRDRKHYFSTRQFRVGERCDNCTKFVTVTVTMTVL